MHVPAFIVLKGSEQPDWGKQSGNGCTLGLMLAVFKKIDESRDNNNPATKPEKTSEYSGCQAYENIDDNHFVPPYQERCGSRSMELSAQPICSATTGHLAFRRKKIFLGASLRVSKFPWPLAITRSAF